MQDVEIIQNCPWAKHFFKKMQEMQKCFLLRFLNITNEISPSEEDNETYMEVYQKTLEQTFEDLTIDIEALKEKYLEKIDRYLNRINYLELKLGLVPTAIEGEKCNVPLKQLSNELKLKLDEYENLWIKKEEELSMLQQQQLVTPTDHTKLSELIEEQRNKLNKLWDLCLVGPAIKNSFPLIHIQEYSDEIFSLFKGEIDKWEKYYDEHREVLQTLENYNKLKNELEERELNVDTKELYNNRGGLLLKEISERNILTSRIKSTENKLLQISEEYKNKETPFLIFGETIEKYIGRAKKQKQRNHSCFLSARTSSKSCTGQRKFGTPSSVGTITTRKLKKASPKKKPILPTFKLNQTKHSSKAHWDPTKLNTKMTKDDDDDSSWTTATDYSDFESQVKTKSRSTSFSGIKLED